MSIEVVGGEIQFEGQEQGQGQGELFPVHLAEALASGDPVFFISDLMTD